MTYLRCHQTYQSAYQSACVNTGLVLPLFSKQNKKSGNIQIILAFKYTIVTGLYSKFWGHRLIDVWLKQFL